MRRIGILTLLLGLATGTVRAQEVGLFLRLDRAEVTGGGSVRCVIANCTPAPAGGLRVRLTCPQARIPAEILIPEGETTVSFKLTTGRVETPRSITLEADLEPCHKEACLLVMPPGQARAMAAGRTRSRARARKSSGLTLYRQTPTLGQVHSLDGSRSYGMPTFSYPGPVQTFSPPGSMQTRYPGSQRTSTQRTRP